MRDLKYLLGEQIAPLILVILALWFIIRLIRAYNKEFRKVNSHWLQGFEGDQFSAKEFYHLITEDMKKREAPHIHFGKVSYTATSVLSPKQEYLEIRYSDIRILVCAAPYGKEFFVSYWSGSTFPIVLMILCSLPIVGLYFKHVFTNKSFYELDMEAMFMECVQSSINRSIELITSESGLREFADNRIKGAQITAA